MGSDSGAVTSYKILGNGKLKVISPSVENEQSATCWIAGKDDGFVYTANTGSDTISLYELVSGKDRFKRRFDNHKKRLKSRSRKSHLELELLDAVAGEGNGPIDLTTAGDGRFLYVLNGNDGTVGMFRINADGSLGDLGVIKILPDSFAFAQGIAGH
jgi:6-phosphogluconolactonase